MKMRMTCGCARGGEGSGARGAGLCRAHVQAGRSHVRAARGPAHARAARRSARRHAGAAPHGALSSAAATSAPGSSGRKARHRTLRYASSRCAGDGGDGGCSTSCWCISAAGCTPTKLAMPAQRLQEAAERTRGPASRGRKGCRRFESSAASAWRRRRSPPLASGDAVHAAHAASASLELCRALPGPWAPREGARKGGGSDQGAVQAQEEVRWYHNRGRTFGSG